MDSHCYLGIDLGAGSGRVMLGTFAEGRLKLEELHRFPNEPIRLAGTMRWDVLRMWGEIKTGLRLAARRGERIEGISVDSWALDYVLMRPGEPMVRAPFCYRDARTEPVYVRLRRELGEETIYRHTGVQFMPINTLYHLAAEAPEGWHAASRFLMIGDWFHFLLSGVAAQEESNASTTQLWDPRARAWSDELIRAAGISRSLFPEVVPPCTRIGSLTEEIVAETGLPRETPVLAGCVHDTGAAIAAVPAESGDDWAYLSSGTWSLLGVELPAPWITPEARAANFTNETGVGGTSRFLRNASGLWMLQECRRLWARDGGEYSYDELSELARGAADFPTRVDPEDTRFLRPPDMPAAISAFARETGQREPKTPGEFARCIFASLAALYAKILESVEKVTGRRIAKLHVVGGGSKSTVLNECTAAATQREVVAGPVEATVIGNILLQAVTLGHLQSLAEVRSVVRRSFPGTVFRP
jgi:rhamnulokinase